MGGKLWVNTAVVALLLAATRVSGAPGGNPGGGPDFDPGSDSEGNHCIAPSGSDWNELLDVSEQILRCPVADAGEFYTRAPGWVTNSTFEVVPEWFTPSGETPMDDFLGKLVAVRYVVDEGTRQERSFVHSPPAVALIRFGDAFDDPEWADYPFAVIADLLPPEAVGEHSLSTFVTLSAVHCDGTGDVEEDNCLPAGETYFGTLSFDVRRRSPSDE